MNVPQSPKLRVALYTRVSTDEQREGQTIDSQVSELERFAADKGWIVVEIFKDEGWSGAAMARPALDRLRDVAQDQPFQAVLINDVDRLARDVAHLGVIKRDLERKEVRVIFRKLPSGSSPTNNLMVNILGSFAEFERELTTDRTRRGRRHKIEVRRQYLGSKSSYGYRYVPAAKVDGKVGRLEIDPDEAAVVRQMYAWVDEEQLSAYAVKERLNQQGVSARIGKAWAKSSVLKILRNEMYAGTWHYNKHRGCEPLNPVKPRPYARQRSTRLRPRNEWIPLELPKSLHLVDRNRWRRVQQQLDRNRAFSPRNEKHSYLLKGLVRCGGCRGRYVGTPCHGKFYYRCINRCKKRPSINEPSLDATVWEAIRGAMAKPEVVLKSMRTMLKQRRANTAERESQRKDADRQLTRLGREEDRILGAYRSGVITPVQLGRQLDEVSRKRALFEQQVRGFREAATGHKTGQDSVGTVTAFCLEALKTLDAFDFTKRQRFSRLLLNEVVFEGSHVKIEAEIPAPDQSLDGAGKPRKSPPIRRTSDPAAHNPDGSRSPATTQGRDGDTALLRGGIAPMSSGHYGRNPSSGDGHRVLVETTGLRFLLTADVLSPVTTRQPRDGQSGRFVSRNIGRA